MSYHREQTEAWLKTIDVKSDIVLDIGGAQLPIKKRVKSWDVKECIILDLPYPHENNVDDFLPIDIEGPAPGELRHFFEKEKVDIAFCIEVSEYWIEPVRALRNINFLLKNNGILYITFPFIYGFHKPEGLDYLRYTPAGVERLLEAAGFEILEHKFRYAKGDLPGFYAGEGMKILNNFDHKIIGSMIKAKKII